MVFSSFVCPWVTLQPSEDMAGGPWGAFFKGGIHKGAQRPGPALFGCAYPLFGGGWIDRPVKGHTRRWNRPDFAAHAAVRTSDGKIIQPLKKAPRGPNLLRTILSKELRPLKIRARLRASGRTDVRYGRRKAEDLKIQLIHRSPLTCIQFPSTTTPPLSIG